jgi:predicted dehydrogenase
MTDRVQLGIVGAGAISLRILRHLAEPDARKAVRVAQICDPIEGRAEAAADRFEAAGWCRSLEELLADPKVDAVTICSPIPLHYEHGLAAIRAGKHVHFNKTMALTASEATHLINEAAANDVLIVASPGEVLRPHLQRIKAMIAEGAIGQLCWAACGAALRNYHEDEPERQGSGPLENIDPSWYFRSPGGGPLYDMTVYALHRMTTILGGVKRVAAMSGIRISEREFRKRRIATEAHDNTLMLLDFGDSLYALAYGTAAGILTEQGDWDPDGRYYGTKGSIVGLRINGEPFDYPGRELADSAALDGDQWLTPPDGNQFLLPHVSGAHRQLIEQHVYEDVMQLVDWLRLGKPSPVSPEHARHVIEVIEASYRAAATGATQSLTTTVDGLIDTQTGDGQSAESAPPRASAREGTALISDAPRLRA